MPRRSILAALQIPLAASLAALAVATPARAQFGIPQEDDGRPDSGAPALMDGPPLEPRAERPVAAGWKRACSFREPICIYAAPGTEAKTIVLALASSERAWEALTKVLRIPSPDADPDGAYRVYLVDRPSLSPSTTLLAERDVRSGFDRASAFTLVDRSLRGCALDSAIAREVARAALFRVAPATDDGSARAESAYLSRLIVPCAMEDIDGVRRFQAHPQHALVDAWHADAHPETGIGADEYARGAALFFWWLDVQFGDVPGDFVRDVWALSPTMTPLGAWLWNNHPNGFDTLRVTFKDGFGPKTTVDDLFVKFAIARAFFGAADDAAPLHLAESRPLGESARVALDWGAYGGAEIAWPTKARRFVSSEGVAPTGAAYLLIHRDGAPKGSSLRVTAEWESFTRMRWFAVKLDEAGKDLGELPIAALVRAIAAQATIYDLDATTDVLLVGVALGDWRYDFDPDDGVWEPHGWMVTVAQE